METKNKPKRQRIKEGDVVAIKLTDGRYVFGREFEYGLGVYDFVADSKDNPPNNVNRFLFIVGVYRDVITSGEWPKVGNDNSISNNSPKNHMGFTIDLINGNYELYEYVSGSSSPSSIDECYGLERVAAWDAEQIVLRIEEMLNKSKPTLLKDQNWIPDILEVDANGNIYKRIKFEDWTH